MADDPAIFAALPDGAILLDAAGAIRAINPAAARLLAIEPADWLGRADAPFVPAAPQERLEWDGRVFAVRFAAVGDAGDTLALYADISAQVRTEREFDLFIACLFSDMRSPFTPLVGFSKLLSQGYLGALSDSQRQAVETIHRSAEAGLNKLWGYSEIYSFDRRSRAARLDQHDLLDHIKAVVEKTSDRFQDWCGQGGLISIELRVENGILAYDRQMIEEVLFLLLTAAVMNSGIEKHVSLRLRAPNALSIQVDMLTAGSPAYLTDEERYFRRLAPPEPNNQINFYIARSYVEAHGGRLWVESDAQHAAFCFTLPVMPPAAQSSFPGD